MRALKRILFQVHHEAALLRCIHQRNDFLSGNIGTFSSCIFAPSMGRSRLPLGKLST
jgi:hypothetical protein